MQARTLGWYGDVALFSATLGQPLGLGEDHVVGVSDADKRVTAAQFRVERLFFPRSSIHIHI